LLATPEELSTVYRELTTGLPDLVSIKMVFAKDKEGMRSKNPVITKMIFLFVMISPGRLGTYNRSKTMAH
jgi:hypothetical protein